MVTIISTISRFAGMGRVIWRVWGWTMNSRTTTTNAGHSESSTCYTIDTMDEYAKHLRQICAVPFNISRHHAVYESPKDRWAIAPRDTLHISLRWCLLLTEESGCGEDEYGEHNSSHASTSRDDYRGKCISSQEMEVGVILLESEAIIADSFD